jgi:hypothetical protein
LPLLSVPPLLPVPLTLLLPLDWRFGSSTARYQELLRAFRLG